MTATTKHKNSIFISKENSKSDEMVREYAYLVKWVVNRLPYIENGDFDRDDLYSCGTIGLLEAIDRYDSSKNSNFKSFAIVRIRGAVFDYLRSRDFLSRGARQKVKALNSVYSKLEQEFQRAPNEGELQSALNVNKEEFREIQKAHASLIFSLNEPVEKSSLDDARSDMIDYIPSSTPSQEEELEEKALKEELAKAIDALPERERLVVALYHYQKLNFKEVGAVLGVSESRASQIHLQAVNRLREMMKNKDLV